MKLLTLLLFLLPLNIFCQNLTGTWIGRETGSSYVKLVIIQLGDSCFGYTYDEGPGFCQANFAGRFEKEKQQLKGRGVNFIARSTGHILGVYNLNYSKDEDNESLAGRVGAKSTGAAILSFGMSSFAELRKITSRVDTTRFMLMKTTAFENQNRFADTLQPIVKITPPNRKKIDSAIVVAKASLTDPVVGAKQGRLSKMVSTIYTNADTVHLMLYDNGIVDDDTVTVFFDNAVILNRYRITEKAKQLDIPLTKNSQPHTVELFANNLGTIPPNTALIIIMAGKERYEVHASYDLSTNAKIIFQYKE